MRALPFALPATLLVLAGCAGEGSYPSLAPRPIERALGDLPAATGPCADADGCADPLPARPATGEPVDDAALRAQIAEAEAQVREARLAFDALAPTVRAAVNRAGAQGTDGWIAAQQQVSRLEGARSPVVTALGTLDRLALERASLPTTAEDQALLDAATREAQRVDALQREELAQLGAALGGE